MNSISPEILSLARWLLAQEAAACKPSEAEPQAAMCICVCEKLREPLSTLAGAEGYKALISRALTLVKRDAPALVPVQVGEGGALKMTGAALPEREADEALKGGAELVAQLLGLLVTFIGEDLTLRLVRDVWPDAPYKSVESETEKES